MNSRSSYTDPWDIYWQANTLDSCVACTDERDREDIAAIWTGLAQQLPANSRVLDLATGNGAVPVLMKSSCPQLEIVGVDKANIDPPSFVNDPARFDGIEFQGGVDLSNLPFSSHRFDAITSQFGIEYAALWDALAESVRVLAAGGRLCFLMHCIDSEIISSVQTFYKELQILLAKGGLISSTRDFLRGDIDGSSLEQAGRRYLEADHTKTRRISGAVFSAIDQMIQASQRNRINNEFLEQMLMRLDAEYDRLAALQGAAKSDEEMRRLEKYLNRASLTNVQVAPFYVGSERQAGALVGWLVQAKK